MLTVSLVIPVLNAERTLVPCLNALGQLNPPPLEIILVDNGSTDGTFPLAKQFQARVANCLILHAPKRGASAARNAGIHAARGDIVAFTDADCAPRPDWLEHVLQPFAEAGVGAVAGKIVGATSTSLLELFSALYTLQSSDVPTVHERWTPWAGGFPTANLAVRRLLLEQLGGFDEDVTIYGEDYDLCARLYEAGSRIAFTPYPSGRPPSPVHTHGSYDAGVRVRSKPRLFDAASSRARRLARIAAPCRAMEDDRGEYVDRLCIAGQEAGDTSHGRTAVSASLGSRPPLCCMVDLGNEKASDIVRSPSAVHALGTSGLVAAVEVLQHDLGPLVGIMPVWNGVHLTVRLPEGPRVVWRRSP